MKVIVWRSHTKLQRFLALIAALLVCALLGTPVYPLVANHDVSDSEQAAAIDDRVEANKEHTASDETSADEDHDAKTATKSTSQSSTEIDEDKDTDVTAVPKDTEEDGDDKQASQAKATESITSKEKETESTTEKTSEKKSQKSSDASSASASTTDLVGAVKATSATTTASPTNNMATTTDDEEEDERDRKNADDEDSRSVATTTTAESESGPKTATTSSSSTSENRSFNTTATTSPATTTATSTASTTSTIDPSATTTPLVAVETSIASGDAVALANILNIVNTNFVNSEGVVVFKNFFETLLEDFDLRTFFNALKTAGCSLVSCASDEVTTNVSNDATIDNSLTVEAISGRNTIEDADHATIETGNAYAGVNLVNVANTNVIDSNYLLVTMNAFKGVEGDIVFPSLSSFLNQLGSGPSSLSVNNTAVVNNTIGTDARTGGNLIDGASSSTITTGGSTSGTNVFNQLNTTLAGQNVSILFRIHGDWAGEVFGAPPGLAWMEDGQGGIYLFDQNGSGGGGGEGAQVHATNSAVINNNVNVVALTGENAISGANTALISTGDAYAGANIMNVANATVVGKNWILAIINILGDFKGNIAFGRPDLWVGAKADVPDTLRNGSSVEYTFTVLNNGDSPATNVVLTNTYESEHLRIVGNVASSTSGGGNQLRIALPDLAPGQAAEVRYTAVVQNAGDGEEIANAASVTARETDNNRDDNNDEVIIKTQTKSNSTRTGVRLSLASGAGNNDEAALGRRLDIDRLTPVTNVVRGTGELVQQHVRLTNTTDRQLRSVVLHDMLYNPQGELLSDEVWELGTIAPNEQLDITYEVQFGLAAPLGTYTLRTKVIAGGYKDALKVTNGSIIVEEGYSVPLVNLEPVPVPQVLGAYVAATSASVTTPATIASSSEGAEVVVPEAVEAKSAGTVSAPRGLLGFPLALAASEEALPLVPAVPAWFSLIGLLLALLGAGILYRHFR